MENKIDEIISIEEIDEQELIDIEVDGNNLFYANGILTHNSQLNRNVVLQGLTPEELNEAVLAESFRKLMISDFMIALLNTPEERSNGIVNFKILKDREGQKDIILPMKINYPQLRIYDPGKI